MTRPQPLLLLLLAAETIEFLADYSRGDLQAGPDCGIPPGDLFQAEVIADPVAARSPVGLRERDAHHAQFGHLFQNVVGIGAGFVHFLGPGADDFIGKFPGHIPDHDLFIGQVKIHF
jgi:hypothetical protein